MKKPVLRHVKKGLGFGSIFALAFGLGWFVSEKLPSIFDSDSPLTQTQTVVPTHQSAATPTTTAPMATAQNASTGVSYCLQSAGDQRRLSEKDRTSRAKILEKVGLPTTAFPDLTPVTLSASNTKQLNTIYSRLPEKEQRLILELNVAANAQQLFLKKRISWPQRPPCN